jgi:hypothetical protein
MVGMLPEVRGFVALAGHTYNLPPNMPPHTVSLHWRKTDTMVLYNGCCSSQMVVGPQCCCDISTRWTGACVSADGIFGYWKTINQCAGYSVWNLRPGVSCQIGTNCLRPTQFCSYDTGYHAMWAQSFTDQVFVGQFLAHDALSTPVPAKKFETIPLGARSFKSAPSAGSSWPLSYVLIALVVLTALVAMLVVKVTCKRTAKKHMPIKSAESSSAASAE